MEKKEYSSAEVDHSSPKDEFQELLQTLEHQTNWDGQRLVKYDGIWLLELLFRPILSAQKYFKAKDTDVILSTMPKSGTTWLKALTFSIANRSVFPIDRSPLLTSNPHKRQFLLENKIAKDAVPLELDEAFDMFCRGITSYGPFWEHMLGYWNAHLKNPERVLFLKYEDLKGISCPM
ncbi:UNVERIFIED_CONTAM: Cytosolic sulfotransferase 15 [Sesamum radiatum]|uniref:Sulfotransferase n=1 Tax=Sesamum radiatum TaxID=300843 RepID=A0AAW2JBL6_SESRA